MIAKNRVSLFLGVLSGSLALPLFAVEQVATAQPSVNIWSTGGQVLLVLVLVIALLFLLTWLLKRSGLAQQAANGHLKVIGGVSVGQRERVLLLQVGQDQILIGVTSVEISLLHVLSEPIPFENAKDVSSVNFAQQLQTLIRRKTESS